LGTSLIVLVCGADPSQPLEESRKQIQDGIATILPDAAAAGVKLAIEPLHPMYADTRSAINTLAQANEMAEAVHSKWVGVAVDVYHLWWDPSLENEIKRCGENGKLFAFHVCDWKVPTTDLLLDRGLMGEGCISLKADQGMGGERGFQWL
jgi:sugar phosphate isomerase/epimerase